MAKKVTFITSASEESRDAQQRSSLGEEILAFVYPVSTRRVYCTFFCPRVRIVAIDIEKCAAVFDRLVEPSSFVVLPPARLVLEMDPGVDYADVLPDILARIGNETGRAVGEVEQEVSASALIFALFADALA